MIGKIALAATPWLTKCNMFDGSIRNVTNIDPMFEDDVFFVCIFIL